MGIALEGAYRRSSAAAATEDGVGSPSPYRSTLARWETGSPRSFRAVRRAAQTIKLREPEHDHHIFHPTYDSLHAIIRENGFEATGEAWVQTHHNVLYVEARRLDEYSL